MRNRITFDDGLILTDADFIGGINYNQNLCGSGDIVVGTVMQQSIKFVVRYDEVTAQSLIGKRGLWEVQWINEDTWNAIGYFNIADVKKKDKVSSSITAYDDFIHTEIYIDEALENKTLTLPTTLNQHLLEVLDYCRTKSGGTIGALNQCLMAGNDTFAVKDNYRAINITAKQVLSYIAQVAGGYFWFDKDGKLNLTPIGYITNPTSFNGSIYKSCTKSLYSVQPINWLIVQMNDDDLGVQVKADNRIRDNVYKITNNPLFYAESDAEIRNAVENVYSTINNITYTPGKIALFKDYGIKCGDYITVDGNQMLITSKRIKSSGVELSSSGNQWREATGEDVNPSIVALRGKTNELYRDIEETRSTLTDAFEGLQSEVRQTANSLTANITQINQNIETQNGEIASVVEKQASMELTLDGFGVSISEIEETANTAIEKTASLETSFDGFESKITSIETTANTANSNSTTAIEKTSELEQKLDGFSVKLESIETTANNANSTAGTANENANTALSKASSLEQTLDGFELRVSSVEQTADTLTTKQSTLQQTVDGFQTTVSETQQIANQANTTASEAKQTANSFSTRITDAQNNASEAKQTVDGLTLSVSNSSTSSTLSLKSGSTTLSSDTISFTGFVSFSDLSTSGKTTINGSNIKTGKIDASLIDVSTIKTTQVYDSTGTNIICKASGTQCEIGGSSTYDFNYLKLYAGSQVQIGMSSSIGTLSLIIDTSNQVIRGMSSSTLWDLGTVSYPFDKIYVKTIYMGSGGGYISMDANKKLLVNGVAITDSGNDSVVDTLKSSSYSVQLVSYMLTPSVNGSYYLGTAQKYWKYLYVNQIYLSSTCYISAGSATSIKVGTSTISAGGGGSDLTSGSYSVSLSNSTLKPKASATYELGTTSNYWKTLYVGTIYLQYSSYVYCKLTCNSSKKLCVDGTAIH